MRPLLKILVPIVLLLAGVAGALALIRSRPELEPVEAEALAPLVRVITVQPRDLELDVRAQGTVAPRVETVLASRVAGEVAKAGRAFEVGAFFRSGDELLRLDDRDYRLAQQRAAARVAQAQVALEREQAEAAVAAEEWEELGEGEPSPLVLRRPQVAQVEADLAAAEADLERANLDLERTRIRAPFAGRLRARQVNIGQYVGPGQALASVQATDYAEVRLPVADKELEFLELPLAGTIDDGPEVWLEAELAGKRERWKGRIVRSEGELDSQSRLLYLLARVRDPYRLNKGIQLQPQDSPTPLPVGLFVQAQIQGRVASSVVALPRVALRTGGAAAQVLVVDDEGRLSFRPVEVLRLEPERALLSAGLEAGERVCISPLDTPVEGMRVRTVEESTADEGTVEVAGTDEEAQL